MIEGGWICRACWKSNRPGDDRCYRCKTPRDQQIDVAAGSLKESTAPAYKMRGRMDTNMSLLAMMVAWPMWLSGWIGIIGGVLAGIGGLFALIGGTTETALISVFGGALIIVVGALFIFLSRSVRRNARWAYVVAAIVYLVPSAPALLGLVEVPDTIAVPEWYLTLQTILAIIYFVLGLGAVFLLITSFIRQGDEGTSASTEAG